MVQTEKSEKQLYQFLGWVEEINNWKKKQRVLKHVYIVKKMQEIQLDSIQEPHKKMHAKLASRGNWRSKSRLTREGYCEFEVLFSTASAFYDFSS